MKDAARALANIRKLDQIHLQDNLLSHCHPFAHMAVTLTFIVAVLAQGKYAMGTLIPFLLYPCLTVMLGDIPLGHIIRRILYVMPLVLFIGIFNPWLDKQTVFVGNIAVSAGWFSLGAILLKSFLTVAAALILICLTGIEGIVQALRFLHIPQILVAQLAFTYRYIHVLGEEVVLLLTAYKLRAPRQRGVAMKYFGSLSGGLFLRTMRRADHIYAAMRCRGFNGEMPVLDRKSLSGGDILYLLAWSGFFLTAHYYDLTGILGNLLMRIR